MASEYLRAMEKVDAGIALVDDLIRSVNQNSEKIICICRKTGSKEAGDCTVLANLLMMMIQC